MDWSKGTPETGRERRTMEAAAVKKNGFWEWMRKNGTGYAFLLPFLILLPCS